MNGNGWGSWVINGVNVATGMYWGYPWNSKFKDSNSKRFKFFNGNSTPTQEPVPPTQEPVPPTQEPVPPTQEPVPPTQEPVPPTQEPVPPTQEPPEMAERSGTTNHSTLDILRRISNTKLNNDKIVPRSTIMARPYIPNLDFLLADIYVRFIAIQKEEFDLHYRVFSEVVAKLHQNMKAVDKYYEKYANDIPFSGNQYDNLRIKKADEFEMDIVIGLPINSTENVSNPQGNDIVIEEKFSEYVQLRAETGYQNMIRDGIDYKVNKVIYEWLDDKKYLLCSEFTDWFRSVRDKALNMFPKQGSTAVMVVDGVCYSVRQVAYGPVWTLIIKSPGFRLDVDLLPTLKFPENRWALGNSYRPVPPGCNRDHWLVVPKQNKGVDGLYEEERSWRLALHDQEMQLMHNTYQLRQTIRLIKKFRDEQGMREIADYYIKTIFLWEILELDNSFWKQNSWKTLFWHMLQKFKAALDKGEIKYFWNVNYNLIGSIKSNILNEYSAKVSKLLLAMEFDYKSVAKYILSDSEYKGYEQFL